MIRINVDGHSWLACLMMAAGRLKRYQLAVMRHFSPALVFERKGDTLGNFLRMEPEEPPDLFMLKLHDLVDFVGRRYRGRTPAETYFSIVSAKGRRNFWV